MTTEEIPVRHVEVLTPHEWGLLQAALGAQQRYGRRGLDNAKEPDAIDRWAVFCVELKRVREKLDALAPMIVGRQT